MITKKKNYQISDPIESFFECVSTRGMKNGYCISRCIEILKQNDT